ncbi:MAG TPA: hypothetical protein VEI83_10460 [Acidimicrobiales bacterium]|nr:hypothetical protein [Acidimicrobiales bacterium]
MQVRAPIALVTAVSAALGLAACGGGSGPAAVQVSTSPTIAAPSSDALDTVQAALAATTGTTADVDLALLPAQVFGQRQAPVLGSGTFDFASAEGRAQLEQPGGVETVLFLPAAVFVRQASGPTILPKGKEWVSAGLTEDALASNFPQFVVQTEALNPVFLFQQVAWGALDAAPLGTTTIAGTAADGYLVTVDLARAAADASGPAAAAFARAVGFQLGSLGGSSASSPSPTTASVRLWVDRAGGRVVRYQATPPGSGAGTITVTVTRYGSSVHVQAPTRATVADIASLSPGGEHENGGSGDTDAA